MNLKYLKQFLQLSEFPSMSQYALKAGVTHAQISRMVIELEKEFGFQLLVRDKTQGILTLTKKGETLVKRIPFIFREIDNMQSLLKSDQDLERGVFDLYTTGYLVDYWISPNLAKFKKDNPLITLNLFGREEMLSPEEKKTMLTVSVRTKEDDDYEQIHLRDFHIGLWASEEYIQRNGMPEHVADLARHVWICFERKWSERSYPTMNWYMNHTDFMWTPSNVILIRSSVGIMKAAEAGLGIFSLAEETMKTMGMKFVRILPHLEGPVVPMCFPYPTSSPQLTFVGYTWKDHISIQKIKKFLFNTFKKEL